MHIEQRRMSVEEWASMPEDDPGELVDGELVEEEEPDLDHETVVAWLIGVLRPWVLHRNGFVFGSGSKLALRADLGRKPDISVFLPGTAVPPRRGPGRAPPDVIVEVISSTGRDQRRDRVEKAANYASFGVRSYWLVDPDAHTFEMFELQPGGQYLRVLGASEGTVDVPGCEGLRLDLDALWAEVERLA